VADVAQSGNSRTRLGLTSMLKRFRQRPRSFDVLLTHYPSRLARSIVLSLEIARRLTAAGVRIEYLEAQAVDVSVLMDDCIFSRSDSAHAGATASCQMAEKRHDGNQADLCGCLPTTGAARRQCD
jgi:hypothetical protein